MVCNRCVKVVKDELHKLGYSVESIDLGEAVISSENKIDLNEIKAVLEENGFELLDDKNSRLIEQIKVIIIDAIHRNEGDLHINFSKYISEKIALSYQYISSLFSSIEGVTIEKFIINQKIEKAKELLVYDELNLSEISYRLGYSSVQHLSNQFKKVTGLTPSHFKKLKENKRLPLDKV